jgi:hypothetical protein
VEETDKKRKDWQFQLRKLKPGRFLPGKVPEEQENYNHPSNPISRKGKKKVPHAHNIASSSRNTKGNNKLLLCI